MAVVLLDRRLQHEVLAAPGEADRLTVEGDPADGQRCAEVELEALRGASMDEEDRTLMSAVIQKVLSAKSGLTEACTSLLTGFDVSKKCMKLPPDR